MSCPKPRTHAYETRDRFTIFRTAKEEMSWLHAELTEGRLRQGWGAPELALIGIDGRRIEKTEWESNYPKDWDDGPSPRRFAILTRMLDLQDGDVVVVPKMPERNQFTIARVSECYRFEADGEREDFCHIVPVDRDSIRTFDYRANEDAFLISGLFARAKHRAAVSFCDNPGQVAAARRLLETLSSSTSHPQEQLSRSAINDAFKVAAQALLDRVNGWNGQRFEEAVRQAFRDQGYTIEKHRHFDGQGADADILVSPPASPYGLFLPSEIAVQVKWRQGVDRHDVESVRQIVGWAEWVGSDAVKYVISSASKFTDQAYELAAVRDVVLISGLQTMCFLLGVPERYRDDWD